MLVLALGVPFSASVIYSGLASSGFLGAEARDKYQVQSQNDLGLLFGGRNEMLTSIKAVEDSPIIGHGSWAQDRSYVMYEVMSLRSHGMPSNSSDFVSDLIPSHSYLMGAWVEGGLAGAVFWSYCLILCIYALFSLLVVDSAVVPFVAFSLVDFVWNILFSPFGAEVRFLVAGQIGILFWVLITRATALTRGVQGPVRR